MSTIALIIVYTIAVYGLSEMVVFGSGPFHIFEKWRNFTENINGHFGELFQCMLCFPTWVGLLFSLINVLFIPMAFTPACLLLGVGNNVFVSILTVFIDMMYTAGSCWLLYRLEECMDRHFNVEMDGEEELIDVDEDEE